MPISTIVSNEAPQAGRRIAQTGERWFLAALFGTGAFHRRSARGRNARGLDDEAIGQAHSQGEIWAAALARGDERKVGQRSPYPANLDIEALYATARAAGGAIALDLGEAAAVEEGVKAINRRR